MYNVVEQAIFDLLRKEVIGEDLDAHIANFFDTETTVKRLSKRLLTYSRTHLFCQSPGMFEVLSTRSLRSKKQYVLRVFRRSPWPAQKGVTTLSKNHQVDRTRGVRNPTVPGSAKVDKKRHGKCEDRHIKQHSPLWK